MLEIKVHDTVTSELNRIAKVVGNPRKVLAACGKELEIGLRDHFATLEARGNKKGWQSKHFWNRQVAQHTALTSVTNTEAVVTVDSPEYVHKITGGTIVPKRGRALALPANEQAYAAGSPRELGSDFLQYVPIKANSNLIGFLKERSHSDLESKQQRGGRVWYWLLKKVTHRPDPNARPNMPKLSLRLRHRAQAVLDNALRARR